MIILTNNVRVDFEVEFMRIKPSPTDFPPTLRKVLRVYEGGGGGGGASYEDIV